MILRKCVRKKGKVVLGRLKGQSIARRDFIRLTVGCGACLGLAIVVHRFQEKSSPNLTQQNSEQNSTLVEARYYHTIDEKTVQCDLCFRRCRITIGGRGYCKVRENVEGKLYTLVYGRPCAITVGSPIEKLPLYHVHPGARRLNLATAGCNFKCIFCINWQFAVKTPEDVMSYNLTPQEAIRTAVANNLEFISFTYTEPTVFYEYMYDISKLAKEKGLKTVFHTNGSMNLEPLKKLLKYIDAVAVDLKAFTAEFYRSTSFSELTPVLETLKTIHNEGVWMEIVNLI
ncbi:radical SAM protein, partial [Candidatus Bathyarchaeota archaeon]|nr:radical SAM protein [Candidatus Bathyarchaeota archaeon]